LCRSASPVVPADTAQADGKPHCLLTCCVTRPTGAPGSKTLLGRTSANSCPKPICHLSCVQLRCSAEKGQHGDNQICLNNLICSRHICLQSNQANQHSIINFEVLACLCQEPWRVGLSCCIIAQACSIVPVCAAPGAMEEGPNPVSMVEQPRLSSATSCLRTSALHDNKQQLDFGSAAQQTALQAMTHNRSCWNFRSVCHYRSLEQCNDS